MATELPSFQEIILSAFSLATLFSTAILSLVFCLSLFVVLFNLGLILFHNKKRTLFTVDELCAIPLPFGVFMYLILLLYIPMTLMDVAPELLPVEDWIGIFLRLPPGAGVFAVLMWMTWAIVAGILRVLGVVNGKKPLESGETENKKTK